MAYGKMLLVNEHLRLVTKDRIEWEKALAWYRDQEVLFYADGATECIYDMSRLEMMYEYLIKVGELYFVEVFDHGEWKVIGDLAISEGNMPITIGDKRYWRQGIGTSVLEAAIKRCEALGFIATGIEIRHYNIASQKLYQKMGFIKIGEDKINQYYIYIFNTLDGCQYPIRRVRQKDVEFLYELKETTLRRYIEKAGGWNETDQKKLILKSLENETNYIIYYEGERVGTVELVLYKDFVEIKALEILPNFQGRHIGRSVVRDILVYHKNQNKRIELGCFKENNKARSFFEKLGFIYIEDSPNYFIYSI